jgi:hypothetical protein
VSHGSGLSRGDRNRNERLARLRELVPLWHAIAAIDLADGKQVLVVMDHDSRVLARRTLRCRPWQLGAGLDWAAQRAALAGFTGVTVGCEPTGHRWQVVGQLATQRRMPFVRPRSARPRSWPRPVTRPGSPPAGRWFKHADLAPRERACGPTPARPGSGAPDDPGCGWLPGAPPG